MTFSIPHDKKKEALKFLASSLRGIFPLANHKDRRFMARKFKKEVPSIEKHLEELPEFRQGPIKYPIPYVFTLLLIGFLCGCQNIEETTRFLHEHSWELSYFYSLKPGIPSHDTFCDVVNGLSSEALRECFKSWVKSFYNEQTAAHYAVDGTACRAARSKKYNDPIPYTVSVFDTTNGIIVDVLAVESKSNEIKAVEKLIDSPDSWENKIFTADALNNSQTILKKIDAADGKYVLPIKEEHSALLPDIINAVFASDDLDKAYTVETNHGRDLEERTVIASHDVSYLDPDMYGTVKTVAFVQKHTETCKTAPDSGDTESDPRYEESNHYYCIIANWEASAEELLALNREHWLIESLFHWIKDNYLGEDRSTNRTGNAIYNMAVIRRIVYNLLVLALQAISDLDGSTFPERIMCFAANLYLAVGIVVGYQPEYLERMVIYHLDTASQWLHILDTEDETKKTLELVKIGY